MSKVSGPELIWLPNDPFNLDYSGYCALCNKELDEPHSWKACAEYSSARAIHMEDLAREFEHHLDQLKEKYNETT